MENFFGNRLAAEATDRLYRSREWRDWTLRQAGTFALPARAATPYVTMIQAPTDSVDAALAELDRLTAVHLPAMRRRGQVAQHVFVHTAGDAASRPKSNDTRADGVTTDRTGAPAELLAVGFWTTLTGLAEQFRDRATMDDFTSVPTGPATVSVWEQAGGFLEW